MSHYGSVEYWNERYTKDTESFEWYNSYSAMKDTLAKELKKEDHILNIGCGDSDLSEDMYKDGYTDITSCDYSSVCIEKMKEKCAEKAGLKWMVEDCHHLSFADQVFDAVIDKGTLDAIICGDELTCFPEKVIAEVYRVLKPNGVYLCETFGTPGFRMDYFNLPEYHWKVTHVSLPTIVPSTQSAQSGIEYCHHLYACRKNE